MIFTDYHVYAWTFTLDFVNAEKMQMLMDSMGYYIRNTSMTYKVTRPSFHRATVEIESPYSAAILAFRDWLREALKGHESIKLRTFGRDSALTEPCWENLLT
jgi:hypothetical protein